MGLWSVGGCRLLSADPSCMSAIHGGAVTGIVSTPASLSSAIGMSERYDAPGSGGSDPVETIELHDAQHLADLLTTTYESSGGHDGYVTVPVSPLLAADAAATTQAAIRVWRAMDRPNVLIGVPGIRTLLPAISAAAAAGVCLNIRALCSPAQAGRAVRAFCAHITHGTGKAAATCVLTLHPAALELELARRLRRLGEPASLAMGAGMAFAWLTVDRVCALQTAARAAARAAADTTRLLVVRQDHATCADLLGPPSTADLAGARARAAALARTGIDVEAAAEQVSAELVATECDAYATALDLAALWTGTCDLAEQS